MAEGNYHAFSINGFPDPLVESLHHVIQQENFLDQALSKRYLHSSIAQAIILASVELSLCDEHAQHFHKLPQR